MSDLKTIDNISISGHKLLRPYTKFDYIEQVSDLRIIDSISTNDHDVSSFQQNENDENNINNINYDELHIVNIGPQHPSTHGLLHLEVYFDDDEIIRYVRIHTGYLHREIEKLITTVNYKQIILYLDRVDYLSSLNVEYAYVTSIENRLGICLDENVECLRIVLCEWNRISSHLIAIGTMAMDIGCTTAFLWAMRDNECITRLFQYVTGKRMLYNYMNIGGVNVSVPEDFQEQCKKLINYVSKNLDELEILLFDNSIFQERSVGIGSITQELAKKYGLSGPSLRSTGIKYDERKKQKIYSDITFDIPIGTNGDSYDRMLIRWLECKESLKIIEQLIDKTYDVKSQWKHNIFIHDDVEIKNSVETARGIFTISLVPMKDKPRICKLDTPSTHNLHVLQQILPGHYYSDLFAILGSLDIMISEVDK